MHGLCYAIMMVGRFSMHHPPCIHHVFFHAIGLALYIVCFMLGLSAGDGNCFYRAMLAAVVEGLCLDPQPARVAALCEAFLSQRLAVESCPAIDFQTKALALQGHKFLQVPLGCQCMMLLV